MSDIFDYRKQVHASFASKYIQIDVHWRKVALFILAMTMLGSCVLAVPVIYFTYFNKQPKQHAINKINAESQQFSSMLDQIEAQLSLNTNSGDSDENQQGAKKASVEDLEMEERALAGEVQLASMDIEPRMNVPQPTAAIDDGTTESVEVAYYDAQAEDPIANITKVIRSIESNIEASLSEHTALERTYQKSDISLENIPTIRPTLHGRITDVFGMRVDPFMKRHRHHGGLDIAAPIGTQVFAPAAGTVVYVRNNYVKNRGYGRYVKIDHGGGIVTVYGHLHRIKVKRGQKVKRWDVIGNVGNTGRSTGPHLHYEIIRDGKRMDPLKTFLY